MYLFRDGEGGKKRSGGGLDGDGFDFGAGEDEKDPENLRDDFETLLRKKGIKFNF